MRLAALLGILLLLPAARPDGDAAPDFTLPDLQGKSHALAALKGKKATVLIFSGIECPRSRASEPRLADMAKKYEAEGAVFLAINSNWHESVGEISDHVKKNALAMPVLKDEKNRVADLYRVEVQPTAIVLDADLRIRYRGLIDDHKTEELVRKPYLRLALEAVLAGKEPETKSTQAVGCSIKKVSADGTGEVTYAKHVARILNQNCVTCHRQGQVGPFTLENYEQAKAWAAEIADVASRRAMPPWKPVTNHGVYYNERRLSAEDIASLEKWHKGGMPFGNPSEMPPAPAFSDEWMLGKPDAVLKAEGGFELGAKGSDEYRCYVLQNPFDEDKWVVGQEYRPGNMRSVHHIIGYLDMGGQSEKRDAADPLPGYRSNGSGPNILPSGSLGGWAPGNLPRMLPEGAARLLRKGERIVLETHYHKTGRIEKDEGAQVALYLAKEPVKKKLQVHMIANPFLLIPPGADNHKIAAVWSVGKEDIHAFDVMPHMHLLGKEMSVIATLPDGTKKDLVVVKDWDFNWQETYQFKQPMPLPAGTVVRVEAYYDNSEKNVNNPSNPPRRVRWGEQTTDEMCIAFVHYTFDVEDRTKPRKKE